MFASAPFSSLPISFQFVVARSEGCEDFSFTLSIQQSPDYSFTIDTQSAIELNLDQKKTVAL
jgi:flagellar assembly factor FliW